MIIDTANFEAACAAYDGAQFSGKNFDELISVLGGELLDDNETAIMGVAVAEILDHRKEIVNLAAKICGAVDNYAGDSADVKA